MKCEICDIIEKHGLNRSAHDLWACSELPVTTKYSNEQKYYALRSSAFGWWTKLTGWALAWACAVGQ